MSKYESVIIMNPKINNKDLEKIINNVIEIIYNGGLGENNFEKTEDLGIKKLAYEIQGQKEGHYVSFYFKSEKRLIDKIEQFYKNENNIMKFIIMRTED